MTALDSWAICQALAFDALYGFFSAFKITDLFLSLKAFILNQLGELLTIE